MTDYATGQISQSLTFWGIFGSTRRQAFQFNVIMVQRPQSVPSTFDRSQVVEEFVLEDGVLSDDCQLSGFLDSDNRVQGIDFVM